jgi:cell pole-organizing protein PopZ
MSSSANKQDMSMDDILASIRSYVSEGQNFPKSESTPAQSFSNTNNVIRLTDEVIPIEMVSIQPNIAPVNSSVAPSQLKTEMSNPMYPEPRVATNPFTPSKANPFSKLEKEISATVVPVPALSADDLLNQLASPLIKSWLDQNLRKIVEEIVQKEIDCMRRG